MIILIADLFVDDYFSQFGSNKWQKTIKNDFFSPFLVLFYHQSSTHTFQYNFASINDFSAYWLSQRCLWLIYYLTHFRQKCQISLFLLLKRWEFAYFLIWEETECFWVLDCWSDKTRTTCLHFSEKNSRWINLKTNVSCRLNWFTVWWRFTGPSREC